MKRIHYGLGGLVLAAVVFQVGCAQSPPTALNGPVDDAHDVNVAQWPIPGNHSMPMMNGGTVPLGKMGLPIPGLNPSHLAEFGNGKALFEQVFPARPGRFANDFSCAACHGAGGVGGASDKFAQNYVDLVNPTSEAGLLAGALFGNMGFSGHILPASAPQPFPLARPDAFGPNPIGIPAGGGGPLQGEVILSRRLATQVAGDGYLMAIPEAQILARAASQASHLGISGVAKISPLDGAIGRIGWKNRTATVGGFNGGAFVNELGVSTGAFPFHMDEFGTLQFDPVPDLSLQQKQNVDKFSALTLAPAPAYTDYAGLAAFKKAGCAECHWDGYTTATNVNDVPAEIKDYLYVLGGGKRVPAYTDLLLHNMGVGQLEQTFDDLGRPVKANISGQGMADGINETGNSDEYRTAPLWGLRFRSKLMHNGAASTIDEAIRLHYYDSPNNQFDSEANEVVNNYLGKNYGKKGNLGPWERAALSRFLRGL